jgi:diaminopimelate epimerase
MQFTKMHGAGNDYVYVDARSKDKDWPALSVAMSDRHRGIGSDGLILAQESDRADLRMSMYNADGSEGKMCGNGIRCLVAFAMKNGIVPADSSTVTVETLSGDLTVTPTMGEGRVTRAVVGMGAPRFAVDEVPVVAPSHDTLVDFPLSVGGGIFSISCVSMGNPHAVAFINTPVDEVPLHDLGPKVEHNPMFPERVNFEIVNILDRNHVKVRVWERGSGLTMACGTGACAVVAVGRQNGLLDDDVTVSLPGGELLLRWLGTGEVILEGPVEEVFEGDWPVQDTTL